MRKRENCPTFFGHSFSDFKDSVVLLRKDLFIHGDSSGLSHSGSLFIVTIKTRMKLYSLLPSMREMAK